MDHAPLVRSAGVVAVLLATAAALTSCAPATDISTRFLNQVPEGAPDALSIETTVYLTAGASSVVVLSFGSSSCVSTPTGIEATGETEVTVTWTDPWAAACSGDLAPKAWWIELPEGFSPTLPFTLKQYDTSYTVQRSQIDS